MKLLRTLVSGLLILLLIVASFFIGGVLLPRLQNAQPEQVAQIAETDTPTSPPTLSASEIAPSETFPPTTLLPSLTPSNTLRPPPTLEPPTLTLFPSDTPTLTPTTPLLIAVTVPGIQGLATATLEVTETCEPREDWALIYTVQRGDALTTIAQNYGTYVSNLASANCLTDPDTIYEGQKIRVPGAAHPVKPAVECVAWELLTPIDYAYNVDGNGQLTFSWIGPRAPRNLIRVYRASDTTNILWEETIDLRQNHTINLAQTIPEGGEFIWYVYPLDLGFKQVDCLEGGPWHFHKSEALPQQP